MPKKFSSDKVWHKKKVTPAKTTAIAKAKQKRRGGGKTISLSTRAQRPR